MIEIREAKTEDCDDVLRLLDQLQRIHSNKRTDIFRSGQVAMDEEEFQFGLLKDNQRIFVAELNEKIVGMIVIRIVKVDNPILKDRIVGIIDDFVVDTTSRKMGIGKMLFDAAKKAAVEMNAESIELNVWGFNENAIHFYEQNGMSVQRFTFEQKLKD